MKTKDEIKQWLIDNASNEYEQIDLSDLDFGDMTVDNSGQKAGFICNEHQKAENIYNGFQEANKIFNDFQEAKEIDNDTQKANVISNNSQKGTIIYNKIYNDILYKIDNSEQSIKPSYEQMSKEELIARIKELENEL